MNLLGPDGSSSRGLSEFMHIHLVINIGLKNLMTVMFALAVFCVGMGQTLHDLIIVFHFGSSLS